MLLSPSPFGSRSAIQPRNLPPSPSRLNRGYNRAPRGAQSPLHRPTQRRVKALGAGLFLDDLYLDAALRASRTDAGAVAVIYPGHLHGGVAIGDLVDQLAATGGVTHAGGGDQHGQQQPERVGGDVPLAALDLLTGVDALTRFGHVGGGLDRLGVQDRSEERRVG